MASSNKNEKTAGAPPPGAGKGFLAAAAVLAAAGLVVALVQASQHLTLTSLQAKGHSKCAIGGPFDCDAVYASRYSEILGVPLATIGAFSFVAMIAMALLALRADGELRRRATGFLFAWSLAACAASVAYTAISILALGTMCPLCLIVHALNFAIAAALWRAAGGPRLALARGGALTGAERLVVGAFAFFLVSTFGLALGATETVYFRKMVPFTNVEKELKAFFDGPVHDLDLSKAPAYGNPNAPVTVVEYGDLECPICRSAYFLYKSILREYGDRVRLVFKHYPLDKRCNANVGSTPHPNACVAAKASVFANEKGKFWEFLDKVYSLDVPLKSDVLRQAAVDAGMDRGEWDAYMSQPATGGDVILKDIAEARKAGVGSTPAFFFNGRRAEGVLVPKMVRAIVDELLAGRK